MRQDYKQGFTLIEIMVAISIFAIVATIATGALISANNLNKKAQAIKLVTDNLNFALDSMTLKLRQGGVYHCTDAGNTDNAPLSDSGADCSDGKDGIAFVVDDGSTNPPPHYAYRLNPAGFIEAWYPGSSNYVAITSDQITIDRLKFYVTGYDTTPQLQPRVLITLHGSARVGHETTTYALQTTVSGRN